MKNNNNEFSVSKEYFEKNILPFSEKPIFNDICDYFKLYGSFDDNFMNAFNSDYQLKSKIDNEFRKEFDRSVNHNLFFKNLAMNINKDNANLIENFYNNSEVITYHKLDFITEVNTEKCYDTEFLDKFDITLFENEIDFLEHYKRYIIKKRFNYIFENATDVENIILVIDKKHLKNNIVELYQNFYKESKKTITLELEENDNIDYYVKKETDRLNFLANRKLFIAIPKSNKIFEEKYLELVSESPKKQPINKIDVLLSDKFDLLLVESFAHAKLIELSLKSNNPLIDTRFKNITTNQNDTNLIVTDFYAPINKNLLSVIGYKNEKNRVDVKFLLECLKDKKDNPNKELFFDTVYLAFSYPIKKDIFNEIIELCKELEINIYGIIPKNFSSKLLYFFNNSEIINSNKFSRLNLSEFSNSDLQRFLFSIRNAYFYKNNYYKISFKNKHIPIKKLLKDIDFLDLINSINNNFKYIQIKAIMGLGKTYMFKEVLAPMLYDLGYTIIFAVPRNILAKQQSENNLLVCFGNGNNKKAIARLEKENGNVVNNFVLTNYDNIRIAINNVKNVGRKPLLILDESDQLIKDMKISDRMEKMQDVLECIKESEKAIFISATPFEFDFLENDTFFLEFESTTKGKIRKPKVGLIKQSEYVNMLTSLIPIHIENNKRVLIFYDNIDSLGVIQKMLKSKNIKSQRIASKGLSEKEIVERDAIFEKDKFLWNNDIKVMLTTQVMSAGVNIYTDRNIVVYDMNTDLGFDNDKVLQDLHRIRNYKPIYIKKEYSDILRSFKLRSRINKKRNIGMFSNYVFKESFTKKDKNFEVEYFIITNNQKNFRSNEFLSYNYNFNESLEMAKEDTEKQNERLERLSDRNNFEYALEKTNRFSDTLLTDYCPKDKKYKISESKIYLDKFETRLKNGSPYFFDLDNNLELDKKFDTKLVELNKENKKIIKGATIEIQKYVYILAKKNFDKLLYMINAYSKDYELKFITTKIKGNTENIHIPLRKVVKENLSSYLEVIENFLSNYFSIFEWNENYKNEKVINFFTEIDKTESFHKIKSLNRINKDRIKFETLSICNLSFGNGFESTPNQKELFKQTDRIINACRNSETQNIKEFVKLVNNKQKNRFDIKELLIIVEYFFEFKTDKENIYFLSEKDIYLEIESMFEFESIENRKKSNLKKENLRLSERTFEDICKDFLKLESVSKQDRKKFEVLFSLHLRNSDSTTKIQNSIIDFDNKLNMLISDLSSNKNLINLSEFKTTINKDLEKRFNINSLLEYLSYTYNFDIDNDIINFQSTKCVKSELDLMLKN